MPTSAIAAISHRSRRDRFCRARGERTIVIRQPSILLGDTEENEAHIQGVGPRIVTACRFRLYPHQRPRQRRH